MLGSELYAPDILEASMTNQIHQSSAEIRDERRRLSPSVLVNTGPIDANHSLIIGKNALVDVSRLAER
jgi:hypothetical protein